MKKFTIPLQFGATKNPVDVYIGDPVADKHPLSHQQAWWLEQRGGVIPPEVLGSFEKLRALAKQHNQSFPELAAHAMKVVNEDKARKNTTETETETETTAETDPAKPSTPPD